MGKTVAAAKREGSVVVSALPGELLRDVLMSFERDYPEIKVKYQSENLRDLWPLVYKELGEILSGDQYQFAWDVRVGGVDASTYEPRSRRTDVKPGNPELALDPKRIDDYLDVSDEKYARVKLKAQQLAKQLLK